MKALWELFQLFIAVKHSTSKFHVANLQFGRGLEGQLAPLSPFAVTHMSVRLVAEASKGTLTHLPGLRLGRLKLLGAGTPESPQIFLSLYL